MAYNSTSWTTDALTKAGATGTETMGGVTLYATFGIGANDAANYTNNTHYPLPFGGINYGGSSIQDNLTFGTDTDPATTFTTADGANTDSSILVPAMWYLPDAITIDSVIALQGLEQAGTNTTRCHLFSYTFTSGSTSALTSGTLLAHSADLSNAGSEQAYLQTWTVDSASVAAGKVILAFFRMDTAADDFSVTVTVKYHLS